MDLFSKNATVVLVHGAWADGSSWNRVILPPLHHGLKVICAPIPLTSLSDDVAALNRIIERTDGPVLLTSCEKADSRDIYQYLQLSSFSLTASVQPSGYHRVVWNESALKANFLGISSRFGASDRYYGYSRMGWHDDAPNGPRAIGC
jgi:hypothetical protein